MKIGIYAIHNTITHKRYIGQSVNIKSRLMKHLNTLRNNKHTNKYLQRAWNKYGESNFKLYTLISIPEPPSAECCESTLLTDVLNFLEKLYIMQYDSFNSGYNLTDGGSKNCIVSEQSKLQTSKKLKNHAVKQSTRKKISNTLKGRVITNKWRAKIQKTLLGRYNAGDSPTAKKVKCLELGVLFDSAVTASIIVYGDRKYTQRIKLSHRYKRPVRGFTWCVLNNKSVV